MKKKYSILIDLDRLKDVNNGLGQVALNLAEQLCQLDDPDLEFTFLVPKMFVGAFGEQVNYEAISKKRRYLPWFCPGYDFWYTIHQDSWFFPSNRQTPYMLTINDLNFIHEKKGIHLFYRKNRLQLKVNRANMITAISHYSAEDIRKNLRLGKTPLKVVYFGVKVKTFKEVERPPFVPDGDLLFSVGVIQPKKNFAVLPAFIKLLPENYKLVIAGNKAGEYSAELEKIITDQGLGDRVILPGIISDEDKYWCYQNCKAVLFPSKLEGMGFPPVEAMRFGKPVFASTFSSIPEVSGDKAYYWENFEPKYMTEVFLSGIKDYESRPGRAEELRQHSMKYTWEESVKELVGLFKEILKLNSR